MGGPEVLDDVRMFHVIEEATFLLKLSPSCRNTGVVGLEEDEMEEFGGTETLAPHGFTDHSIGPTAEDLVSE